MVQIVLFLPARRGRIVVFAGADGSAAHQRNPADAYHVASLEGFGQRGFHGVEHGAGALPSHRTLVGGHRSAARRSAAISAPAPHAADAGNADAADTWDADAAAAGAPPAAGVSAALTTAGVSAAATAGVSAAGASASAAGVAAAITRIPCPGGVLRLDRFGPGRFGDQAVDLLAAPIGGRLLVPKVPGGCVERQPGGHSRAGQQKHLAAGQKTVTVGRHHVLLTAMDARA